MTVETGARAGRRAAASAFGPLGLALVVALASALAAGLATAQTADGVDGGAQTPRAGETVVSAEDWGAKVVGRTVHWSEFGAFAGREYYSRDGASVVFIDPEGRCFEGRWAQKPGARPGLLCFAYVGPDYSGTHCDQHFQQGERFYARRVSGSETTVLKITDEVLSCDAPPTS